MFISQRNRSTRRNAFKGTHVFGALGLMAIGYVEAPTSVEAEGQAHTIINGNPESGFPEVGGFDTADTPAGACTGTLIDPSWILTAKHCDGMIDFMTGPNAESATRYPLGSPGLPLEDDQRFGGYGDITLIHLKTPIVDVPVAKYNRGALPSVGKSCTAVGYGLPKGTTTRGIKRSGALVVTSAGRLTIATRAASEAIDPETGKPTPTVLHPRDSGGPLFCDGVVVGVARSGAGSYTPVDPEWVARTMADPTHPDQGLDASDQTDTAAVSGPVITEILAAGSGCPAGTWDATIADDGQSFTIAFDALTESVGPGTSVKTKFCNVAMRISNASNARYAVQSLSLEGNAALGAGTDGAITVYDHFVGSSDPLRFVLDESLASPQSGPLSYEVTLDDAELRWSACGDAPDLRLGTRIVVGNAGGSGSASIDLTAARGQLTVSLAVSSCD